MAEKYGPFNAGGGASFDETQWREWIAGLFTPGVVKAAKVAGSAGGDLAVTVVGGNMNVSIATGVGLVYGFAYENDAALVKTITTQGGGLNRIDYVVLKLDFVGRTVQIVVKSGTAASSPVAPTLTQSATTWEVPLCQVFVTNGASVLVSGNLTDSRAYCSASVNPVMGAGSGLDADLLDGRSSGHASGNIPISDSVVNTGLNADMVDGFHAGNASGQVGVNNGTVNTNNNSDMVDSLHATSFVQLDAANEASTPVKIIITDVLPAAGTKGRLCFKTPFAMP